MVIEKEHLVHLTGYAAIAGVLASASWAGIAGSIIGYSFVLAVLYLLFQVVIDEYRAKLRKEATTAFEERDTTVATEAGEL